MAYAALVGCHHEVPQSRVSPFIHAPPISQQSAEQLHALAEECEKYPETKSARGPYDAAYCDEAIAAWADSPLQLIPLPPHPADPPPGL